MLFRSIRKNPQVIDNVKPEHLPTLKKYGDFPAEKLFSRNDLVYELLPDEVATNVYLRKRRKL